MTTSSLIAFCGPKFAGKTTAAKALPPGYMPYAFANPIRAMLRVLGVPEANLTDPALKEVPMPQFGGKSAREMMQFLGTEWGRAHGAPRSCPRRSICMGGELLNRTSENKNKV